MAEPISINNNLKNFLCAINEWTYTHGPDVCINRIYAYFNDMHDIIYNYKGDDADVLQKISRCKDLQKLINNNVSAYAKVDMIQEYFRQIE